MRKKGKLDKNISKVSCSDDYSGENPDALIENYKMAHNFNSALFRVLLDYLKPEKDEKRAPDGKR